MLLQAEREAVVAYGKKLIESGLVKATGGNLSLVNEEKTLMAISPTGVAYETMQPEDVVVVDLSGQRVEGKLKPSSEIAFHLGLVNLRADIRAVVHTHSPQATAMACLGWTLPAVHYLIGFAGKQVPVAPYATYGTQALSDNICKTIGEDNAVLMANHGMVAVGSTLEKAYTTAEMVEYVAQIFLQTRAVGNPIILRDEQMDAVLEKFETYGKQDEE